MKALNGKDVGFYLSLLVPIPLWYALGYDTPRKDFFQLISIFSLLFFFYALSLSQAKSYRDYLVVLGFAFSYRLILFPAFPFLSDDVFRFIWDGRLLAQGIDPFAHLPFYYIDGAGASMSIQGIEQALFEKLNSPEYFSVYPPLCQWVFALTGLIFPKSIWGSILLIKGFILLFETGIVLLLEKIRRYWELSYSSVLLYVLNPLVIAELTGNLHFEAAMIFFMLLAFWLLLKNNFYTSAITFSGAVNSKILPLIFLPALIRRIGLRKTILYGAIAGLITIVSFLTVMDLSTFGHLFDSLGLYFQTFELNASIYYLFRWIGFQWAGYNMIHTIGPLMAGLAFIGIVIFCYKEKHPKLNNLPQAILGILTIYLVFSTTVHPWYIIPLLAFGCLTRFRFPFVWSFLILLSYATYRTQPYDELYWLMAIEYVGVIGFFLYEWKFGSITNKSSSCVHRL